MFSRFKKFSYLEIDLVTHCNLNCIGCSHFSPIVEPRFADIKSFERDLKRLRHFNFPIKLIRLMGGEPLLHPEILSFLNVTRKYFNSEIRLVTNGLLLASRDLSFWENCSLQRIVIEITQYPIKIDLKKIQSLAKKNKVKIIINKSKGKMRVKGLSIKPKFLKWVNFLGCMFFSRRALCTTLLDGNIYPCSSSAYIKYFNKKFKTNLPEEKGLNIHLVGMTREKILNYINTPPILCKHCTIFNSSTSFWGVSKLVKDEWLDS